MSGIRCVDGRAMMHDPQPDDPYLEKDIGECLECDGKGCYMGVDGVEPLKSGVDRSSHSYLLGVCQYERDKYLAALRSIITTAEMLDRHDTATTGGVDGWNSAEAAGAN